MPRRGRSTCGIIVGNKFTIIKPIRYQEYKLRPGYTGVIESIDQAGDVLVNVSFPNDGHKQIWILNQHLSSLRIDKQAPGQFPSTPRKLDEQMGTLLCTEPVGQVLDTFVSPVCGGAEERGQLCESPRTVRFEEERAGFTQFRTSPRGESRLVVGCRVVLEQPLRGLSGSKSFLGAGQPLLGAGLQADICCFDKSGNVLADFGTPYMQVWLSAADLWKLRVTKVAARRFLEHGQEYHCESGKAYAGGNSGELPGYSDFHTESVAQFGHADCYDHPAGTPSCRTIKHPASMVVAKSGYADCYVRPAGLPSCRTCDDLDSTFASNGRAMGNADLSDASDADTWSAMSFGSN